MFLLVLFFLGCALGKIYERCELARELKYLYGVADDEVATWVCIAEHESQYNTSAVGNMNGDGSRDHGIFQINDGYWCSPPGRGFACGLNCSMLEDDDIEDDFNCVQRIRREHELLAGNGFSAWAVYAPFCKEPPLVERYAKDCFGNVSKEAYLSSARPPGKKATKKVYPWLLPTQPTSIREPPPPTSSSQSPARAVAAQSRCSASTPAASSATQELDSAPEKATSAPGSSTFGVELATPGSNELNKKYVT